MEDYSVLKLKNNCIKEFKFIAKIHDYIFAVDKLNYIADYKKIDRAVKSLSNRVTDFKNVCYVAMYNEQIIGYIWLKKNTQDDLKIESIWTLEEFRNQGIAATLCKYATIEEYNKLRNLQFVVNENIKEDIATMIAMKLNNRKSQWQNELAN